MLTKKYKNKWKKNKMEKVRKRIEWIDYLKAFACILVVLGHLIQSLQKSGIDNNQEITSFINWFIYLFHMPVFFFISGYLYEKRKKEFSWSNYKKFEVKKIINLAIPYFTFYLLFVGINMMFSDSVNNPRGIQDILNIFNKPMAPYWFLYALLSIFIAMPVIEKIFKDKKYLILFVLLLLKVISVFIKTNIYFLDSIFSNAIYFYIGNFINIKMKSEETNKIQDIFYNVIFISAYIIIALVIYTNINRINEKVLELIKIVLAVSGTYICIRIFKNVKKSKILDTMKQYTFQIYLLHTIFAAGIRIFLFKIENQNYNIHFILGLFASIYLPVLIAIICEKTKYLNFIFYPTKTVMELKRKETLGE